MTKSISVATMLWGCSPFRWFSQIILLSAHYNQYSACVTHPYGLCYSTIIIESSPLIACYGSPPMVLIFSSCSHCQIDYLHPGWEVCDCISSGSVSCCCLHHFLLVSCTFLSSVCCLSFSFMTALSPVLLFPYLITLHLSSDSIHLFHSTVRSNGF